MSISCFGSTDLSDDSNFLFSRLDPFLILRRVSFFTCKAPSDGAEEISGLTSYLLPADLVGSEFWEARGTGEAAVIGQDRAEPPRSPRHLFRHVSLVRSLRDVTGSSGPTRQPLRSALI